TRKDLKKTVWFEPILDSSIIYLKLKRTKIHF
ncbi:MAG: hypothetical protein ACJAZR_002588, partial [Sediminicola sp.]